MVTATNPTGTSQGVWKPTLSTPLTFDTYVSGAAKPPIVNDCTGPRLVGLGPKPVGAIVPEMPGAMPGA